MQRTETKTDSRDTYLTLKYTTWKETKKKKKLKAFKRLSYMFQVILKTKKKNKKNSALTFVSLGLIRSYHPRVYRDLTFNGPNFFFHGKLRKIYDIQHPYRYQILGLGKTTAIYPNQANQQTSCGKEWKNLVTASFIFVYDIFKLL